MIIDHVIISRQKSVCMFLGWSLAGAKAGPNGTHRTAVPGPTNSAISIPGPKQAIILAGMHVPQ